MAGTSKKKGKKEEPQPPVESEEAPPIWEWMAQQHLNPDPECADAASHVNERWGFNHYYNHARALRSLQSEQSEYLHGLRKLTEQYTDQFGLEPNLQIKAYGSISPLIPLHRERCSYETSPSRFCKRDAVPGTGLCGNHGGQWITDAERLEIVKKISGRLVDISDRAVHVISDLMDNARSEKVRLEAAIAVLDRIGLSPVQQIELNVTNQAEEAAALVLENLNKIGEQLQNRRRIESEILAKDDDEVLEAEFTEAPDAEPQV